MVNQPLLSILIPTKNRQYTCLYAIESVILLNRNDDVEIIVQDCSDDDSLKAKIMEKFGNNANIKYEHQDTKPSMTENWNRAFARGTGYYKCGIGDDDAVLPSIYEVAKWAKQQDIDAIGHSKKYNYFWSDFSIIPGYSGRLVKVLDDFDEETKIYTRDILDEMIRQRATIPNMDYRDLPIAYHTLLSGKLIERLVERTGVFLDGTSLDVYSGFALGLLVNKYYVLNTPFTLPGACGSSNSNRTGNKKYNQHFEEFKNIYADERIPRRYNLAFTIAESTQKAFSNLNDEHYHKLLDLPYLYVEFMAYSFNIDMFKILLRFMRKQRFRFWQYIRFSWLLIVRILKFVGIRLQALLNRLTGWKTNAKPTFPAGDIIQAMALIPQQT